MKKSAICEIMEKSKEEREAKIEKLKADGVLIPFCDGVFVGDEVSVAPGTLILGGCVLTGRTKIETDCVIGPNTYLDNVTVGEGSSLNNVVGDDAVVGSGADLGPFVHLRPNTSLGQNVHLGNFVEVKNSSIDDGTKVSHLTYVGDSDVGKNVNFGCGCVTVNYTGKEKFRTKIGDHAFIGCNTNLIAPVSVGDFSYTAAGSTITDDVPEMSLGIARARQTNKEGWVEKKKPYKDM